VPQKAIARKALVCAPSNAAIDELAKRLKDGVWNSEGVKVLPRVVRLGDVSVKDISLDNLVEERLSKANSRPADNAGEVISLRNELARLKKVRQQKQDEMNSSIRGRT
jgi:senataxin